MSKIHKKDTRTTLIDMNTQLIDVALVSFFLTIVTRNNSPEIWAVKLWFLLIYEKMLKSIVMACSEYTENKASHNTEYIVPDLIDFFVDDWKEIKT